MKKNNKLVPKFRFHEFKNSPSWNITNLGKISSVVEEKAGKNKYIPLSVTSGIGLISQTEKFGREISGNSYKNYIVIRKYDFAYNKSATKQFPEGFISMLENYDIAAVPNSIFICFRITDKQYYPNILNYLFYNNYHGYWLRKYIEVGGRAHGSLNFDTKHLWDIPIVLPSLEEQQKIADCLASIDDLIEAEKRKSEALKKYKKALMQKLFPSEDSSIPELRFAEFKDSGEWENKKLSDIGEIITGKTPNTSDLSLWGGDIQFVTPTDITEKKYQYNTQRNVVRTNNMKILPKNTIMFTSIASIGKMALSVNPCITNQQINSIIPTNNYDNEFIYYSILQKSFYIKLLLANTTLPIINKTEFSKITISITSNKKEQQKISDCLASIDSIIDSQVKKIDNLIKHKKALMQGLFPDMESIEEYE